MKRRRRKQLAALLLAAGLCFGEAPFYPAPPAVQAAEREAVSLSEMWAPGACNTWLFCGGGRNSGCRFIRPALRMA